MNNMILGGRVCSIPKIKVLQLEDQSISICTFTLAVVDGVFELNGNEGVYSDGKVDFFQCIAFGNSAQMINANFIKGSKIICKGKMKNHFFEDTNRTKHFTQALVVDQAEFGDTEAVFSKYSGRKKPMELSIVSDLKEICKLYESICSKGFLCIDEDEYYKIAISNI